MREYISWHLTIKTFSQLGIFVKKIYIPNCQSKAASLLDAVMIGELFPRVRISNLTVPASTERELFPEYLLECFTQFFLLPRGQNYAVFPRKVIGPALDKACFVH